VENCIRLSEDAASERTTRLYDELWYRSMEQWRLMIPSFWYTEHLDSTRHSKKKGDRMDGLSVTIYALKMSNRLDRYDFVNMMPTIST